MTVMVTEASAADEPVLQHMVQLYTHDFSELWAGTDRGDLLPDGRFAAYALEEYWTRPAWRAMLLWCNGRLAGFALVNDGGHSGEPTDCNMAEFFVLRKYRRQGVGRLAAEAIFSQMPGRWEVAVARKNTDALAFWRRTIEGAAGITGTYEIDVNNDKWNGQIIRYNIPACR